MVGFNTWTKLNQCILAQFNNKSTWKGCRRPPITLKQKWSVNNYTLNTLCRQATTAAATTTVRRSHTARILFAFCLIDVFTIHVLLCPIEVCWDVMCVIHRGERCLISSFLFTLFKYCHSWTITCYYKTVCNSFSFTISSVFIVLRLFDNTMLLSEAPIQAKYLHVTLTKHTKTCVTVKYT